MGEGLSDERQCDEVDPKISAMLSQVGKQGLMNGDFIWLQACQFYRHDPTEIEQGVHLPGIRYPVRAYQMLDGYKGNHLRLEGFQPFAAMLSCGPLRTIEGPR